MNKRQLRWINRKLRKLGLGDSKVIKKLMELQQLKQIQIKKKELKPEEDNNN